MTIWNNAGRVLRRTFAYSGRAGRIGFWWWAKLLFGVQLVLFVLQLVPYVIFERILPSLGEALLRFLFAGVLVWFFGFLPTLSLTVRRLHDTGRSGLCIMGLVRDPGLCLAHIPWYCCRNAWYRIGRGRPAGHALLPISGCRPSVDSGSRGVGDLVAGPGRRHRPQPLRGCRTMTGRFRQNGVGEGVRHATYGG